MSSGAKPLSGLRVTEFTHMVMGPTVGLILADLGADVTKVEPINGDKTRALRGSGAGYFPMYNRNKLSISIDAKSVDGKKIINRLIEDSDVFIENFRPGALEKLGFDYETLKTLNPGLIYCSEKGFLDGPYSHRTALDEVAQMMGGLAYMTGPPGRPLRAGASVIDVGGGMFGVIAILAALHERQHTGVGQLVSSSLFETSAFFVGQHMAQHAVTGTPAAPMPSRVSAWAVYDVFDVMDGEKVFVGVVSDTQWTAFCKAFELDAWAHDKTLSANNDRVARRDEIIPQLRELFAGYQKPDLIAKLENIGLPFAPITKPEELISDPHLQAAGGLVDVRVPYGTSVKLPALPLSMNNARPGLTRNPPTIGEHTRAILTRLGLGGAEIDALEAAGTVNCGQTDAASVT